MVSRFDLKSFVKAEDFENMATKHLQNNRYAEAANIINKFEFHAKFDVKSLILKLIDIQKIETAKMLADHSQEYQKHLIEALATNENCKQAAKFIVTYGLQIDDYPNVKERLLKSTMRYYLGRNIYKKFNDEEYLPIWKIEDMFKGLKAILGYFVEDLMHKKRENVAKGIYLRNYLGEHDVRPEIY